MYYIQREGLSQIIIIIYFQLHTLIVVVVFVVFVGIEAVRHWRNRNKIV